ncbi:MAG: hypothetical protein KGN16_11325 [Burkholderiales bacterium]|nr:hypothetical protein [Burkholderiales bacterium]
MRRPTTSFAAQYIAVVIASLIPVIVTTFLCVPYHLGWHPGTPRAVDATASGHMT